MNDVIKSCKTCAYNTKFLVPHTCDICTSLDADEYCMWKQASDDYKEDNLNETV